jgi:hypothetical protein
MMELGDFVWNVIIIKNKFPMSGAKYFTKLDLNSGFHRIRMSPRDEYAIAFKTHHGIFNSGVMPFGLTNAPATF